MIPFFRKTRKELLGEDKTRSYLLYAIGEIFLVVVGILIALQINNWNEDRKQGIQETKYLKNIQTDINVELKNNDEMIAQRARKAKAASHLLFYSQPKTLSDLYNLERKFEAVYFWIVFIPTNNTFKELLSSGNLNTITNDYNKHYLLELDKLHVDIHNTEQHMRREYEEYIYDVSFTKIDILNFMDFENIKEGKRLSLTDSTTITKEQFKKMCIDYDWMLNNQSLKNGLKLAVMNNMSVQVRHYKVKRHLERLNELITTEVKL